MSKFLLGVVLLIPAVAHRGYIHREDKPLFYPVVTVKDCYGGDMDIYADNKMTTPLKNPLVADETGKYLYYTKTPYVTETILFGSETIIKSTCPEGDE